MSGGRRVGVASERSFLRFVRYLQLHGRLSAPPTLLSLTTEALIAEKPEKKGGAGAMGGMPDMGDMEM
jgi:hypothetical protein